MGAFRWGSCLAAGLLAVLSGCGESATPAPKQIEQAKQVVERGQKNEVTFVLSGDTAGFIVPCGCTTKQFGGLPRRASYLSEARKTTGARLICVDAGGSVARGTVYDALKFEFILKGMTKMKVAALNIGAGEMRLGPAVLGRFAAEAPLFSSNVRAVGKSLWPEYVSVELPADSPAGKPVRIAFAGVCLNAGGIDAPGLETTEPQLALRKLVPLLASEFDAVVLLVYGEEAAAVRLAAEFPELAAVFLAGTGQPVKPRQEEGSVIAAVAQKGKFLAKATLAGFRNHWKLDDGEIVELAESFADDPAQLENLAAYKAGLKEAKFDPSQTGEAPMLLGKLPGEYRYSGSSACAKCHAQDSKIHADSQHARGLETLRNKDFAFDPFCLKCHTVGYGGPGGFLNAEATPELGGIGCENCHGPSQAHVLNPHVKTLATNARGVCLSCHDPENSPKFEYTAYWRKILHGQEKAK